MVLGSSSGLEVGHSVYGVGNATGLDHTLTRVRRLRSWVVVVGWLGSWWHIRYR